MGNALNKWFTHRCTILTYTGAANSLQEWIKSAGTVSTGVPCRYIQEQARIVNPDRTEQVDRYDTVLFPGSVSLQVYHRLSNVVDEHGSVMASLLEVVDPNTSHDIRGPRITAVTVKRVGHGSRV